MLLAVASAVSVGVGVGIGRCGSCAGARAFSIADGFVFQMAEGVGGGDRVGTTRFPGFGEGWGRGSVEVVLHDLEECIGVVITGLHLDCGFEIGKLDASGWVDVLQAVEDLYAAVEIGDAAFADGWVVGCGVG